ncbi:MAG TPA: MBL fold metallo-hydrolase [Afifellaceae bacterium]|nr:MBL fold metallo-hydrolase [Afifellaceae bacterium]
MVLPAIVLLGETALAGVSRCLAVAEAVPQAQFAAFSPAAPVALTQGEARLTYVGHSTFLIESTEGVRIATDFTGFAGAGVVPDVVTMNHAHTSHYTDTPDPRIRHVLRGWNPAGGPARHNLTVGDVMIRNVSTDIRNFAGIREEDGNSIFIFELAGLCIGHLGHLHHELGPEYLGLIGQLDIVLVPVDGSFTMAQASMINVLKLLKARLIIPMHYFGPDTLARFLNGMREDFEVEISVSPVLVVSVLTLPKSPKVLVLPGY